MHYFGRFLILLVLVFLGFFTYKSFFVPDAESDVVKVESYLPKILTLKKDSPKPAEPTIKVNLDSDFSNLVDLTKNKSGRYSVYMYDIVSKKALTYNETDSYYAASLYKFPFAIGIMQQVQNNKLSLDRKLVYKEKHFMGGTGSIQKEKFGTTYTVEELLIKLLKESDNVAQNMLAEVFDMNNFAKTFKPQFDAKKFPYDMQLDSISYIEILKSFVDEKYLDSENTFYLLNIMSKTSFDNYIYSGLGDPLTFAHKIGSWPTTYSWHDCGVVYFSETYKDSNKVLVCVMSEKTTTSEYIEVTKKTGEFINRAFFK